MGIVAANCERWLGRWLVPKSPLEQDIRGEIDEPFMLAGAASAFHGSCRRNSDAGAAGQRSQDLGVAERSAGGACADRRSRVLARRLRCCLERGRKAAVRVDEPHGQVQYLADERVGQLACPADPKRRRPGGLRDIARRRDALSTRRTKAETSNTIFMPFRPPVGRPETSPKLPIFARIRC